jgi:hypothetical protein
MNNVRSALRCTYLALCCLILLLPGTQAAPIATLTLRSQPGDFIGGGGTFNVMYPQATDFYPLAPQVWSTVDGVPAELAFVLGGDFSDTNHFAIIDIGTNQLGVPLRPGTYLDAQRDPFAAPGHPGLSVSFDHKGCNVVTGSFTVTDASFPNSNTVSSFAVSFEQHCEGAEPALFGTFSYAADASAVVQAPEPQTWSEISISGLILMIWRHRRAIRHNEEASQQQTKCPGSPAVSV